MRSVFFILVFFWAAFTTQDVAAQKNAAFEYQTLTEAQKLAKAEGKKVVIDFYAQWCGFCKKMEREVYTADSVGKTMNAYFHFVRVDIESDEKLTYNGRSFTMQELAGGFGIRSTPTFLFLDDQGKIIGSQPGYMAGTLFGEVLSFVGSDAYKTQKFEDFSKSKL